MIACKKDDASITAGIVLFEIILQNICYSFS